MKPLWASVFMMLAMFLQSSKEKAERYWVRGMILTGAGASSESRAGPVSLPVQVLCPKDPAVMWRDCRVPTLSTGHLHPIMTQCCTEMDPCPRPEGWGHPCPHQSQPVVPPCAHRPEFDKWQVAGMGSHSHSWCWTVVEQQDGKGEGSGIIYLGLNSGTVC